MVVTTEEVWETVTGFPDYKVSNLGRICSTKYKKPRILKTQRSKSGQGYCSVVLRHNNKSKTMSVHRLVAEYFCEGSGEVVMHLDNDPTNNHFSNLKWGTQSENIRQGWSQKRISGGKEVKSFVWGFFSPTGELTGITDLPSFCRREGLDRTLMNKVSKGKRRSHKGWTAASCAL